MRVVQLHMFGGSALRMMHCCCCVKKFAKSIMDLMFIGDTSVCARKHCLLYDNYTSGDD